MTIPPAYIRRFSFSSIAAALLALLASSPALSQDTLKDILIDGCDWELVADGFKFTDGPAVDAQGSLYFSDVAASKIYRLRDDGTREVFVADSGGANGLMFGASGRLYACQVRKHAIVAYDTQGKATVIVSDLDPGELKLGDRVVPNDLVVTRDGGIYFTDPDNKAVMYVSPQKKVTVVDRNIDRPNGIILWPGQGTLVVSDTVGPHLWAFRIENDASLAFKEPFYTMALPPGRSSSGADGLTVDTKGRVYVATYLGIQVFDAQGRLSGIIAKPDEGFVSHAIFAGPKLDTLYATCTDKVYRRKTKATGLRYFDLPNAQ